MIEGQHTKGFCYRSEKFKLIFVPVPKVASTSVKAIKEFEFIQDNLLRLQGELLQSYTVFTIVRDPLTRFISSYIEVCARASGDSPHILGLPFYWCRDQKQRFMMFIDELDKGVFDPHLLPLYYLLTDWRGVLFDFDYVLEMENLDSDFSEMLCHLGIPLMNLERKNATSDKEVDWLSRVSHFIGVVKNRKSHRLHFTPILPFVTEKIYRFMQRREYPDFCMIKELIESDVCIQARIDSLVARDIEIKSKLLKKSRSKRNQDIHSEKNLQDSPVGSRSF